ncbi:MAG: lysozyme inhibitor LprI family protein [Hyphomicrobiales bacterium]
MQKLKPIIALAFFAAVSISEQAAASGCENAATQIEINLCMKEELERADKALSVALSTATEFLSNLDKQSEAAAGAQSRVDVLSLAQKSWASFRDAHCKLAGLEYAGGSIQPLIINECKAKLARQRMEQLLLIAVEK